MAWFYLVLAGLFEMTGVAMINKLHRDKNWQAFVLLLLGFGLSFIFLALAMETLPMGTAYAVWTGIGAAGGAILGMLFYNESRNWKRILLIGVVLGAAVGLKLVSG
ncbi:multidrug efflux SMR transporter [Planomicrobium sp. YIM 101495]|uniref:DMT family transporter n=1 Tax=Planomicrobium sp. YIM 101495 TaxID=2665160 RepID=UPI0012BA0A3F|nr:multidrug efflux SMR transporter [Planomicrobium sp. YIM 101495]MTD31862.1 QacE family quaternary ammonium compound efflux SMR transporter [Planomicrobium sp. YIM 101495]